MPIIKLLGSSLYIHSQPLLHHFPNILWITSFHNPYLCVEIQWTVTLRMNIHIKCTHHSTYLWIVLYIYISLYHSLLAIQDWWEWWNPAPPPNWWIVVYPKCIRSSSKCTFCCWPQSPPTPTPQTWFPHHAEVDVFFSFELMTFEPNIYFV